MARRLTPNDAHLLINAIAKQALGSQALTATDTSSFISVGETLLRNGVESTLSALSIVIGKTIVAIRPYTAKLGLIQVEDGSLYSDRIRKISFYDKGAKPVGWVNTQLHEENLYDGADNNAHGSGTASSVASMWEQNKPIVVEVNMGGSSVFDYCLTVYPDQMKKAFRDEDEFITFYTGCIQQVNNELEFGKEQFTRATLLNYMAGLKDMGMAVDLVAAYNDKFGTELTGEALRSTHLKDFLAFMVATVKTYSQRFTNRTSLYHWNPTKIVDGVTYDSIARSCPKDDQRLIMYSPLFIEAEALVLPEIFNDKYLKIENAEMVDFWQSFETPEAISITPAIPNTSDPTAQTVGAAVALPYVVGVLFDKDACMVNYQFDGADVSPKEARRKFQNTWFHVMRNGLNDFTFPGILFYMAS